MDELMKLCCEEFGITPEQFFQDTNMNGGLKKTTIQPEIVGCRRAFILCVWMTSRKTITDIAKFLIRNGLPRTHASCHQHLGRAREDYATKEKYKALIDGIILKYHELK